MFSFSYGGVEVPLGGNEWGCCAVISGYILDSAVRKNMGIYPDSSCQVSGILQCSISDMPIDRGGATMSGLLY